MSAPANTSTFAEVTRASVSQLTDPAKDLDPQQIAGPAQNPPRLDGCSGEGERVIHARANVKKEKTERLGFVRAGKSGSLNRGVEVCVEMTERAFGKTDAPAFAMRLSPREARALAAAIMRAAGGDE
jgi:hypothetical protein